MGFFKDFKEDLNETASDFSKNSSSDEEMVNTQTEWQSRS